jgi:putative Mg2+ transporter-C (MgtC) family protein
VDYFDPFAGPFWATVGYAILCGGIIGLERQFHGKTVGVRTSILICLGTAVFIGLGAAASGGAGDPARVLGQVVTGIGFIGGGVIISHGGQVRGVTTAAGIWLFAAVGATIGLGHHLGAVALSLATVVILVGIELLEAGISRLVRRIRGGGSSVRDP